MTIHEKYKKKKLSMSAQWVIISANFQIKLISKWWILKKSYKYIIKNDLFIIILQYCELLSRLSLVLPVKMSVGIKTWITCRAYAQLVSYFFNIVTIFLCVNFYNFLSAYDRFVSKLHPMMARLVKRSMDQFWTVLTSLLLVYNVL